MNLGKRLRELRLKRGYSSAEKFSYEFGINRVQYGRYESGANITFATLLLILSALEISVKEFFSSGFES